jgi:hypothetical protein
MNATRDRCRPAVRANYCVERRGELYLCGHCTNQPWTALCAQGWTIWRACNSRSPISPFGAAVAGQPDDLTLLGVSCHPDRTPAERLTMARTTISRRYR